MQPIVINIHNLVENLTVTDSVQGRQELEDSISETLNKVIQNAQLQVEPEPKEPFDPRNSNEFLQNKISFFESAHQLEEYLRRSGESRAVETPLKALFAMKEFFLETVRANEHLQLQHTSSCRASKLADNDPLSSGDIADLM